MHNYAHARRNVVVGLVCVPEYILWRHNEEFTPFELNIFLKQYRVSHSQLLLLSRQKNVEQHVGLNGEMAKNSPFGLMTSRRHSRNV